MRLALVPLLILSATACDGGGEGFVVGQTAVADCPITEELSSLEGTTWVMDEAQPDGKRLNAQARLKFIVEDGKTKALYTVKSGFDVYTYDCDGSNGKEFACAEPARVQDWCQAMEVYEPESCRIDRMKAMGAAHLSDEEINKAIAEAKATVAKFRGGDDWKQFRTNNNNLGNKLRGLIWAKPNKTRCNLRVQDMYMTVYNGKKVEDSNPVGTNPFALSTEEYLWDHCDSGTTLADAQTAERPKVEDVGRGKFQHETGKKIYYHYYGDQGLKAEDGCTYSFDSYGQWRPSEKDVAVAPTGGALEWKGSHTFSADDHTDWFDPKTPQGIFAMVRYKTCGGTKTKIDTVCNTAKVMTVDGGS